MERVATHAIKKAREAAGHTQRQAGETCHANERMWQKWEHGTHRMPLATFHYYRLRAHLVSLRNLERELAREARILDSVQNNQVSTRSRVT